jgi:hypothetical protein
MNMSTALPPLADIKEDREVTWIRVHTVICGKTHKGRPILTAERLKIDSDEGNLI